MIWAKGKTHSQKANACDDNCANMVPAERSLVNLSKSQPSPLVGISNMRIIVVEIVEGRVASRSSGRHCQVTTRVWSRRVVGALMGSKGKQEMSDCQARRVMTKKRRAQKERWANLYE